MNWKLGIASLACSLIMTSHVEAARQLEKTVQNPRTLHDTSSMLQEMHGQMKIMQEQLGSLKASQQLLSAESAIKNLTPKVRKLEVHLERVEKQLSSSVSSDDIEGLKRDVFDVKSKLSALINAPDTSVDATLSAINPTLERMQKQVYFLHEAVKTQSQKHEMELQDKLAQVADRISQFENSMTEKLIEINGTSESLTLIRQAILKNHGMINNLKLDVEAIKNEKLGQLFAQVDELKLKVSQDGFIKNMDEMKQQIKKLAVVFKNSLDSIHNSSQIAEKSLSMCDSFSIKLQEFEEIQKKHTQGIVQVFHKEKAIHEQIDSLKDALEKKVFENLPVDKISNQILEIKTMTDQALEKLHLDQSRLSDLEGTVSANVSLHQNKFGELENALRQHSDALSELVEKTQTLVSKDQLSEIKSLLAQDGDKLQQILNAFNQDHDKLSQLDESIGNQNRKLNYLYAQTKDVVKQEQFQEFSQNVSLELEKHKLLAQGITECLEKVKALDGFNTKLKARIKNILAFESNLESFQEKLAQLQSETLQMSQIKNEIAEISSKIEQDPAKAAFKEALDAFSIMESQIENLNQRVHQLYDISAETRLEHHAQEIEKLHSQAIQIETLKMEVSDLSKKLEANDSKDAFKQSLEAFSVMEGQIQSLNQDVRSLTEKLSEKDAYIAKLAKKVAFLTKSLQDKEVQSQKSASEDLGQFKTEIHEKIEKELKNVRSDRMVFETLIQRIAALEAALSADDTALEESN